LLSVAGGRWSVVGWMSDAGEQILTSAIQHPTSAIPPSDIQHPTSDILNPISRQQKETAP
jgi:hypothetical protein